MRSDTAGDLISRSAVKRYFCECCNNFHPEDPCEPGECSTMEAFDEQPAVDAVEVPNCEECFWNGRIEGRYQCEGCIGNARGNRFLHKNKEG